MNPFTGKPVPSVNAHNWQQASITDLWEQMSVLNARLNAVGQLGKLEYIGPLRNAIAELQETIRQRTANNENLIT
ncbi:hypothetical protein D3C73_1292320 [compost metagenome]